MNGIYVIYYTGAVSTGHALVLLQNGVISGADVAGGIYDGSYSVAGESTLEGEISIVLPPGARLVTGASAGSEPMSFKINLKLPLNFSNGQPQLLNTSTGPVNAIFKKLRNI